MVANGSHNSSSNTGCFFLLEPPPNFNKFFSFMPGGHQFGLGKNWGAPVQYLKNLGGAPVKKNTL